MRREISNISRFSRREKIHTVIESGVSSFEITFRKDSSLSVGSSSSGSGETAGRGSRRSSLENERREVTGIFIFLSLVDRLPESVTHVIRSAETLHLFSKSGNISRGHETRGESRGSGSRHWSRNTLLTVLEREVVLVERIGVSSSKSELTSLGVLESHSLPIEEIRQSLGAVTLVDTLPASLLAKGNHLIGQLVD